LDEVLALEPGSDVGRWLWLTGVRGGANAALELWDADAWHVLAERQVQVARDMGALVRLQFALQFLARSHLLAGDLTAAAQAIEEDRAIAAAIGTSPVAYTDMLLAAWRGQEALTFELIERRRGEAGALGIGRLARFASHATAVLYTGLGRYDAARDAARPIFEQDDLGHTPFVVPEVAEAASRTGDAALLKAVTEWMAERSAVTPTDWALGMEARVRALASEAEAAEPLYVESIERLGRTRLRLEAARARLLYGEWLRRESRRVDAREQLRLAREAFLAMGAEGFAERARHELLATGEKVRKRRDDTRDELTPQEEHIARLARDGRTNPEIGAELFLSPRTVEWHLKKVFTKLGITSRRALRDALPREQEAAAV
jgi:DNA-binding CsgD family transcriptional regulator